MLTDVKTDCGAISAVNFESGGSSGDHSRSTTDKNDCRGLYDAVLNSDVDTRNGQESNTVASSGSEDEALAELVKEYETDDVVGTELQNEQLAKPVNKLFRFNETQIQMHLPKGTVFGNEELKNIDNEIKELLNKGVIVKTKSCPGEFISNIFATLKKR